jgi:hypothetical protein
LRETGETRVACLLGFIPTSAAAPPVTRQEEWISAGVFRKYLSGSSRVYASCDVQQRQGTALQLNSPLASLPSDLCTSTSEDDNLLLNNHCICSDGTTSYTGRCPVPTLYHAVVPQRGLQSTTPCRRITSGHGHATIWASLRGCTRTGLW